MQISDLKTPSLEKKKKKTKERTAREDLFVVDCKTEEGRSNKLVPRQDSGNGSEC